MAPQAEKCEFESRHPYHKTSRRRSTEDRYLAKVVVVGSNPIACSTWIFSGNKNSMRRKKKKVRDKVKDERRHFKRRLKERYSLEANRHDIHDIIYLIQHNKCNFVLRQSNRITVWDVPFKGETVRIVYDKVRKAPVTALLLEWDLENVDFADEEGEVEVD